MNFFLVDIDYRKLDDIISIVLYGRDTNEMALAVFDPSYRPYFYVLPSGSTEEAERQIKEILEKKRFFIEGIEKVRLLLNGVEREFLRITCFRPQDTQKARDIIKTLEKRRGGSGVVEEEYEYQIGFYRAYLPDKGFSCVEWFDVEGKSKDLPFEVETTIVADKIDKIHKKPLKLKILSFDTEVVEEKRGQRNLVMLSLYGENLRRVITYKKAEYEDFVEVVPDERALIQRFVELIREYDPDVIVGYNSDLFDFDVLRERASKLKVKLDWLSRDGSGVSLAKRARVSTARLRGRVHIDIFNFINNILQPHLQTEVLSLDAVSSEILEDEKIEMEYEEIVEAWRKQRGLDRLAVYNLKDSELTYRLSEVLLPQINELTIIVGQSLFDTSRMMYSQLVEWFYTKKAKETRRIIPNQPKFDEIKKRQQETYIGGYVKEPIAGLHENIAVVDFASLYPSIISTYNISIETLNCECCKDDAERVPEIGHWFCKKKKGFESSIIEELLKERQHLKEMMKSFTKDSFEYHLYDTRQKAVKTIANASYGYYAFPASKWYSKECAESVTAYGRYWIKNIMQRAEAEGYQAVYGDTDSAFLLLGKHTREELIDFLERLNRDLPGIMRVDLEGFYLRGIFIPREIGGGTAKKRYALVDEKGNLKIRGLEKVRRDWSRIAKQTQESVLRMVLKDKNIEGAVNLVKETVRRIKNLEVTLRDLVVFEQISKPIEKYKQLSPHVGAAKKLRDSGVEIMPGTVIGFVIQRGEGSVSERAVPIEFARLEEIDRDYYIKNQIIPPSLRILRVVGVQEDRIDFTNPGLFK